MRYRIFQTLQNQLKVELKCLVLRCERFDLALGDLFVLFGDLAILFRRQ